MALIKDKQLTSGVTISYWRPAPFMVNYDSKEAYIKFLGYVDKAARDNNAPLFTIDVRVKGEDFEKFFPPGKKENIITQAYKAAKALDPFFKDATADAG